MKIDAIKIPEDTKTLQFLYRTIPGRIILRLLCSKPVSVIAGAYMDSSLSIGLIPKFAKKNHINMDEYVEEEYTCFNDFFIRHIRPELRPVDMEKKHFIAPCDGLLSAYKISDDLVIPIKQSEYSILDLVKDKRVAKEFEDGVCLVFRLCVNHYHRYCYLDNAKKSKNVFIPGLLHTVRPVALNVLPVFTRNAREYTLLKTENFGTVLQMEVGAMMVGKIVNHDGEKNVVRGDEKGYFKYGGSTVVVLVKKNKVDFAEELFDTTDEGMEIPVHMGQMLGKSK